MKKLFNVFKSSKSFSSSSHNNGSFRPRSDSFDDSSLSIGESLPAPTNGVQLQHDGASTAGQSQPTSTQTSQPQSYLSGIPPNKNSRSTVRKSGDGASSLKAVKTIFGSNDSINIASYSLDDSVVRVLLDLLEAICGRLLNDNMDSSWTQNPIDCDSKVASDIGEAAVAGQLSKSSLGEYSLTQMFSGLFSVLMRIRCRDGPSQSKGCLLDSAFLSACHQLSSAQDDLLEHIGTTLDLPQQRLLGAIFATIDLASMRFPRALPVLGPALFNALTPVGRSSVPSEVASDADVESFAGLAGQSRMLFPFYFTFARRLGPQARSLNLSSADPVIDASTWHHTVSPNAPRPPMVSAVSISGPDRGIVPQSPADIGVSLLRKSASELLDATRQRHPESQQPPLSVPQLQQQQQEQQHAVGPLELRSSLDDSIRKLSTQQIHGRDHLNTSKASSTGKSHLRFANLSILSADEDDDRTPDSDDPHGGFSNQFRSQHQSQSYGAIDESTVSDTNLSARDMLHISQFSESRTSIGGTAGGGKGVGAGFGASGLGGSGLRDGIASRWQAEAPGGSDDDVDDEFVIDDGQSKSKAGRQSTKESSQQQGWATATKSPKAPTSTAATWDRESPSPSDQQAADNDSTKLDATMEAADDSGNNNSLRMITRSQLKQAFEKCYSQQSTESSQLQQGYRRNDSDEDDDSRVAEIT